MPYIQSTHVGLLAGPACWQVLPWPGGAGTGANRRRHLCCLPPGRRQRHEHSGRRVLAAPGGLDADYLAKQLHDFQSGERQNATMLTFANMLNDQQIADVAAYYSQLPATPGQGGDVEDSLLARGQQLAERGDWNAYIVSCQSCHGPGGYGVGSDFPGIAGQHAGYISAQLHAWKNDTRHNDPQHLMGAVAKRMSDDDIAAVSAWYAAQPPQRDQEASQ